VELTSVGGYSRKEALTFGKSKEEKSHPVNKNDWEGGREKYPILWSWQRGVRGGFSKALGRP